MIELHISAGHAWSVWKTEGGLQPTVESLAIPPEFGAPLQEWTFRKVPGIHAPTFTGRQKFDAEGRALAAELQRSVGDRFHVVFRHWAAFDPTRWQTQWREEDLLSGSWKDFWIHEDLPDGLEKKVVQIYPDCGGAYLWDLDGCCIGNEDPVFADDLDKRFMAWSESWDACFDTKTMKIDKVRLAHERFDERGLALATELKQAIGQAAKVVFYCNLRESALEVLEDGKTIEWPRETDFRQWALDHTEGPRAYQLPTG